MEVKIDTKEKFDVITLNEPVLSDKLAAELTALALDNLAKNGKSVVLKIPLTNTVEDTAAEELCNLQQSFYEANVSFVICEVQKSVEARLDEMELLEVMNITPTESEAWDIVQMEEIERELMKSDDVEFNSHGEV